MVMNTKLIPFIDISTENTKCTNYNSIYFNIITVVIRLMYFLHNL